MGLKRRKISLLLAAIFLLVSGCGRKETAFLPEQETLQSEKAKQEEVSAEETSSESDRAEEETEETVQTTAADAMSETLLEILPARYDAREHGRTASVKNQGDLGTCWAFASLLALESSLLPAEVYDFSEDNMSNNPNFTLGQEVGGDYTMSMAYLLSWQGPVLEEEDPYGDGESPEFASAVKHVQEIQLLPERNQEAIKQAVLSYGGVQSSLYTDLEYANSSSEYYDPDQGAYCCPEDRTPNHDVVIVGWNDDYPKENFPVEVPENGAYLCENSWGPQFGEDGFFYVSYYDMNLGKTNICYTSVEAADNYDKIYQSDLCGWIGQLGYGEETAWAANVYQAGEAAERLQAVGFYATGNDTDYEVYLIPRIPSDPDEKGSHAFEMRRQMAKGHLEYSGYYTIQLNDAAELDVEERFAVAVRLTTPGAVHPIAIEYDTGDGKCKIDLSDGEGYISPDGISWNRAETMQNCNLCLKAYTVLAE